MREAVNSVSPDLDKLNEKFKRHRTEAKATRSELVDLVHQMAELSVAASSNDDAISNSGKRLREFGESARQMAIRLRVAAETADEMYDRLSREGRAPQGPRGFLSREEFVRLENQRRAEIALVQQQAGVVNALRYSYERLNEAKRAVVGEDPSAMYDRLRRIGQDPRTDTGFMSREEFVERERQRRSENNLVNQLRRSYEALGESIRDAFRQPIAETPDELFDRLGREGQAPRDGGRFQTRADFVEQENARRAEAAALKEQERLTNRVRIATKELTRTVLDSRYVRVDDIAKGIRAGLERKDLEDLGIEAEIRRDLEKDLLELDENRIRAKSEMIEKQRDLRDVTLRTIDDESAKIAEGLALARTERDKLIREEIANRRETEREIRAQFDVRNADLIERLRANRAYDALTRAADIERFNELVKQREQEIFQEREASEEIIAEHRRRLAVQEDQERDSHKRRTDDQLLRQRDAFNEELALFNQTEDEKVKTAKRNAKERLADVPNQIAEATARRREFPELDNRWERGAARITLGLRDLRRGFAGAREGLSDFNGAALRSQATLARFGASIGAAVADVNQFVNIRWFLVISFVQILLTFVIQLGGALVAMAASAIMAGAALGGALVAGAAQALPVIGLLAAAMNRLQESFEVIELREKARDDAAEDRKNRLEAERNATDALADARYNLARAQEGVDDANQAITDAQKAVTDAIEDQREAVSELAVARREAARAMVDAALEEREANLSLREAELGVLEAKERLLEFQQRQQRNTADLGDAQAQVAEAEERLRIAQREGDQAEISSATQQISLARQNVNEIRDQLAETDNQEKQLRLGIERADLNLSQAQIRQQRAREENRRRQRQGVEGSPEVARAREGIEAAGERVDSARDNVVRAQENRRDALHRVDQAQRQVTRSSEALVAASAKQSEAAKKAADEFNKLSKGQQQIVLAAEELIEVWNSPEITGITDIILQSFARVIRAIVILLEDPEIQEGFRNLAESIADIVDSFARWLVEEDTREDLLFFIKQAAENLPILASAAGNFAEALIDIAIAADPLFTAMLEGLEGWGEGFKNLTGDSDRLEKFFERAGSHAGAWVELAAAVGDFILALTDPAAETGLSLVEDLAGVFRDWAREMREDPEGVRLFFEELRDSLLKLMPILGDFIGDMVTMFASDEFHEFTTFVLEVLLPALLQLFAVLNKIAEIVKFIADIVDIPVVDELAKLALQFIILRSLLGRLFPIARAFFTLLGIRRFLIFGALYLLVTHLDDVRDAIKRLVEWFKDLPGWMKPVVALLGGVGVAGTLIGAMALLSTRLGTVLGLGTRIPGMLGRIVGAIGGARGAAALIGKAGLAGAVGVLSYELTKAILKWTGLEGKLKDLGGAIADFATSSDIGRKVTGFITGTDLSNVEDADRLDSLAERYGEQRLVNAMRHYMFLRRERKLKHREALIETAKEFRMSATDLSAYIPDTVERRQYALGGVIGARGIRSFMQGGNVGGASQGEAVPIIAHVGEWVLNKKQQNQAAALLGTTPQTLAGALFGQRKGGDSFDLGGLIGKLVGTNTGSKRGKALEGYEDMIRDVLTTYRALRRDFPHKETMFALKSQYPRIPRDTLDAMIPPSYRLRKFLLGGIVQSFGLGGIIQGATDGARWLRHKEIELSRYILRDPKPGKAYSGLGGRSYLTSVLRSLDPRTPTGLINIAATAFGRVPTGAKGRINPEVVHNTSTGLKWSGSEKFNWRKPPARRPPEYSPSEWRWIMYGGKEPAWLTKAEAIAKSRLPKFMLGGPIEGGKAGAAVPILAHVGEWVLNKAQQQKLARRLSQPLDELRMWLFGTAGKQPGGTDEQRPVGAKGKTKPKDNPYVGPNFKLHPHEDEAGQTVWFVELASGRWGQVSARAAKRIMESQGKWLPGYVHRANRAADIGRRGMQSFATGGVVSYNMPGMQSFAQGGTVVRPTNPIISRSNSLQKQITQNLEINTASPTVDIDYIMRVGAMHAEAAY